MKQDNSNQNPWAGLSSYEDPAKSEQKLKFCGRDNETKEVTRLIDDNFFVTLYGKSGIGKTSLLNAGVFPALRREQYMPLSLRLGMTDGTQTFQDIITTAIEHSIEECGGSVRVINVVEEQTDRSAIDYLWNWFARHYFLRANGQATFPVIVFDQFEEVFRHQESRQKTEVLLTQLHYLIDESHALNDCIVNGEQYYYDFNFRFVLSIREDDLYRLEDSIDNCAITALKRCRYRLRSLSEQSAEAVILVPGEGFIKEDEQKGIVDTIIGIARNKEDKSISTNVLSLICNRIFVDFQRTNSNHITLDIVDNFIKGNPFERFYNEATRGFTNKEKSYIEDHLVDSTGRRNSMPENDFLVHVPKGKQLLEGDTRILQRTSTSSDGTSYRIELIHDSFCEPLAGLKTKREHRRKMLWFITTAAIALLCIGITTFILFQLNRIHKQEGTIEEQEKLLRSERDSINRANKYLQNALMAVKEANSQKDSTNSLLQLSLAKLSEKEKKLLLSNALLIDEKNSALKNQVLFIAKQIDQLIEEGDYLTAQKLSLEILSDKYPYTAEAAAALIKSTQGKSALFHGHTDHVTSLSMSSDGTEIISASLDGTIRLWNIKGECLRIFNNGSFYGYPDKVKYANFSPNGEFIVSGGYGENSKIWNKSTGQCIRTLDLPDAYFLSNDRMLVCGLNEVRLYDLNRDRYLTSKSFKKFKDKILSKGDNSPGFTFSRDRSLMLSSSRDSCLEIWDTNTFEKLKTLKHDSHVWDARFNDDNSLIVSTCNEGLRVWDVKKGICKATIEPKKFFTMHAFFSPDQNHIIVGNQVYSIEGERKYSLKCGSFFNTSQNNKYLLGIGNDSKDVCITEWNLVDSNHQYLINNINSFIALYGRNDNQLVLASNSSIYIWDYKKEKCIKKIDAMGRLFNSRYFSESMTISKDKRFLVSTGDSVRIWRTDTWDLIVSYGLKIKSSNYLLSAELSSDNYYLTVVTPKYFCVLNITNDEVVMSSTITNKISESWTAAKHSHKGKFVAASRENGTMTIYNFKSGNIEYSIQAHNKNVSDIEFSPDDQIIASASWDHTIKLWSTKTGKCIRTLYGHANVVNMIKFANQGKWLVSTSYDRSIKVWDVNSGICLKTIHGNFDSAEFSSDNKTILASSLDGIYLLPFPSLQEIINETRQRFVNSPLTHEERKKYYLD